MPNLGVATLLSIVALENIFSIIVKRRICNRKIFNDSTKVIKVAIRETLKPFKHFKQKEFYAIRAMVD